MHNMPNYAKLFRELCCLISSQLKIRTRTCHLIDLTNEIISSLFSSFPLKKVVDDTAYYCGLNLTRIYNVLGKKYKRKMITYFTECNNIYVYLR